MLIAGAGGFARQILFALKRMAPEIQPVLYTDFVSTPNRNIPANFELLESLDTAKIYFETVDSRFCLGTGILNGRVQLCERLESVGGVLTSVIDPSAIVKDNFSDDRSGISCLANVIVEPDTFIGKGVLLNLGAMVTHEVEIGEFSEIGPGVKLLGKSKIGQHCLIGAGAIVMPGVQVGDRVIIGAGSVVTRNIPNDSVAFGVPARLK